MKKVSVQCNNLTKNFPKIADIDIPEAPTPLE